MLSSCLQPYFVEGIVINLITALFLFNMTALSPASYPCFKQKKETGKDKAVSALGVQSFLRSSSSLAVIRQPRLWHKATPN